MNDASKPIMFLGEGFRYLDGFCEILKVFKKTDFPLIVFAQLCMSQGSRRPEVTMWQYWVFLDNFTVNFLVKPINKDGFDKKIKELAPVVDTLSAAIKTTVTEIE